MRPLPFPKERGDSRHAQNNPVGALPAWLRKAPIDAAYWPMVIVGLGLTLGVLVGWKVKRQ